MSDSTSPAGALHALLARVQAGDRAAADELFRTTYDRLNRLTRKMLAAYPRVERWVDTDDVLQNAVLRLLRSLRRLPPNSVREFYGLAATHIRRELLDLSRHYYGVYGSGANHESAEAGLGCANVPDGQDAGEDPAELEKWRRFHEAVERLPVEEREVVGLIFYHGWEQSGVAELFGVTVRTVQRRWQSAVATLGRELGEGAQVDSLQE